MNVGRDLLQAVNFAADKHRDQRRKNVETSPYINHPIQVAELLARIGEVDDLPVLIAAVLHDTVEDTETTLEELENVFGPDVSDLVAEVTDDKSLPKAERKKEQIKHTVTMTDRAKLIKLADKTCNVRDVAHSPPEDWNLKRRKEYLDWASKVIEGCRGTNAQLGWPVRNDLERTLTFGGCFTESPRIPLAIAIRGTRMLWKILSKKFTQRFWRMPIGF